MFSSLQEAEIDDFSLAKQQAQQYKDFYLWLGSLGSSKIKLGVERINLVLEALGKPQDDYPVIHVVGTNGKGSTSAILSSLYVAQGYKVGLFTSPHLVDVRERIVVNGQPITQLEFVEVGTQLKQAMQAVFSDEEDYLTYFEFITAMGLLVFSKNKVDLAIIEAGLGGRLDSTNVFSKPMAVVITPISLDHLEMLGDTLEKIAFEKASVIKPQSKVILAQNQPIEALSVINKVAIEQNARCVESTNQKIEWGAVELNKVTGQLYRVIQIDKEEYAFGLLGHYQYQNLCTALQVTKELEEALPINELAFKNGLKNINWPGRLQYFPERELFVDGSHNPQGLSALVESLKLDFKSQSFVLGLSLLKTKALNSLDCLADFEWEKIILIDTDSLGESQRYWPSNVLEEKLKALNSGLKFQVSPLTDFIYASYGESYKILTGSLYTAGEALKYIQSASPKR